jgi:hypothetical protein
LVEFISLAITRVDDIWFELEIELIELSSGSDDKWWLWLKWWLTAFSWLWLFKLEFKEELLLLEEDDEDDDDAVECWLKLTAWNSFWAVLTGMTVWCPLVRIGALFDDDDDDDDDEADELVTGFDRL